MKASAMFTRFLLPLVATGLLVFAVVHVIEARRPDAKIESLVEPPHAPYANSVAGAGMVEAEFENVSIGSTTPGVVVKVFVKVGQNVQPGTELFALDDRQLQAELKFRQAAVDAARAELTRLENQPRPEQLEMVRASLSEAEANMTDQQDQLNRTKDLYARKVTTDSEMVTRQQAFRMSRSRYARARAEYDMQKAGAWEYDKAVSRAAVEQAEAQLRQVQTDIDRLTIRSLAAGQVLQLNVRPGEFVGAPPSQALVVVGKIDRLHVRVDIDEYDIPRFNSGAPARAMLKGQPQVQFPLEFVRVEPYVIPKRSLTGDNTERVDTRVLQVIYEITENKQQLYVGQQMDVFIDAADAVGGKANKAVGEK
jgi:HlyD family secretion protein